MKNKKLKIIKLQASNIKTLKAIEIEANGKEVILKGSNGAGKSSILIAIMLALSYKKGSKIVEKPLRKGEKTAIIKIDLGELIVERKFIGDNTYLKVTNKNGTRIDAPQTLLDKLIGEISFDPMEFSSMESSEQAKILMELAGISFTSLNEKREQLYNERRDLNRDGKSLKIRFESLRKPAKEDSNLKEVSVSKLTKELKEFNELDAGNKEHTRTIESLENKLADASDEFKDAKEVLLEAQSNLKEAKVNLKIIEWTGSKDISEKLESAEEINEKIRNAKEYSLMEKELKDKRKEFDVLQNSLDDIDAKKQSLIENAKYPLKGLSVNEEGVFFKDSVFSDLSDGQRLLASTYIAMALNPNLRVIFIKQGSMLDSSNLKLLRDLAEEKGYQLFLEVINSDEPSAIHIIDGAIEGQDLIIESPIVKGDEEISKANF